CLVFEEDLGKILETFYPEMEIIEFKEFLESNNKKLIKAIRDDFEEKEIEINYLAEVTIQERKILSVKINDNSVIEEKDGLFYVIIKAQLEFELKITCNDPNGYFYVSEDKEYIYVGERIEKTIYQDIEEELEIECELIAEDKKEWSFYIMSSSMVLDYED